MPLKKILKIAGLILLAFFILYFGLIIVVNSFRKTTKNTGYNQPGVGTIDLPQDSAPLSNPDEMYFNEITTDSAKMPGRELTANLAPSVDKKIIKTGNLVLKVEKAEAAEESLTNIAKLNKGEISNSNFAESSRGIRSGYVTIRVPYQNFATAFAEIKKIATQVISESTNTQDITAEYIDLEARLKNKRAEENSFVALFNRSGKIEETISVTREVARVRGEIEQLEGQMRYLNSQTDMSTITINLSEDVEIASASEDWRPWQVLKTSVKQLITNGQNFIDGLIRFLIITLPMLLIYVLIIWLIYYIGKKIYRRFKKSNQQ